MRDLRPLLIAGAVLLYGLWTVWRDRAVTHPAGVLAEAPPTQIDFVEKKPAEILFRGARLQPMARFRARVRLLAREWYKLTLNADLSPIDLCVGWGSLSDSAVLSQMSFTQTGRFCFFHHARASAPVKNGVIGHQLANIHILPANALVESQLKELRRGQILDLDGTLVNVTGPGGREWRTSLSRTDTGDGACEVLYLEHLAMSDR